MKALIFLAHGSRRQQSNSEVEAMVESIRSLLESRYDSIDAAFLEIAAPSLSQALDQALERGMTSVTVYPYFLNSGNHVEQDIPSVIEQYSARNPQCEFNLLKHFGHSNQIAALIVDQLMAQPA